ncbi:DUF2064 domain-containing protein [Mycobacterium sp. OTB74]|jgi:rSAM/selenodomain-associated transferase 1|uniref:TIGR04282 family arsenosugar biosynthesis glycosyltransferase n=1 Tax=Mycobacterium sp. OTB74 TaxID=1853452 RepID=UPI002476B2DF|nr:DUF2064 domain-containing protein [Mycobacterium sp. OTB74]MDH6244102.1 rSAM/selenodomain-associated transferase 1 [Mycobacterium sp. OTB74]
MTEVLPVAMTVLAKAPVPGLAKTRLAAAVGTEAAADIAAAALLDTLEAVSAAPLAARSVALTGDLDRARSAPAIRELLAAFTVFDQRGDAFAERLANAHRDAGGAGYPVLQIGMDTPQITADVIGECARALLGTEAVLGPAEDGGWWLLGLHDPEYAECLRTVPMSQPDTGERSLHALRAAGLQVQLLTTLADVDTIDDIETVRRQCLPNSNFHRATTNLGA